MSRYVRNKSEKSTTSDYLMPVVATILLIAVVGGYFVVEWLKQFSAPPEFAGKDNQTAAITATATYAQGQSPLENGGLQILPAIKGDNMAQRLDKQPVLPNLLDSDVLVRQEVGKISPGLLPWLSADQLIRRYMVVLNDFAKSQRIAGHMSFIRLEEPFLVEMTGNDLYISAKCYQRYNLLVQSIQAIDAKAAIRLYKLFRPLMLQVFAEFGYPKDVTLEATLKKAVAQLLAAPVIREKVALVRPSLYYKFADNKLETLNPVQKQMLRMGPDNTRIIQAKLREFMAELAKADLR